MVRCARYLEIIRDERLVENAARVGAAMKQGLESLACDFDVVTNVRGRGLFLAMDLPDGAFRAGVRQGCWDRGLAALPCGPRSLRFRPPLVFSEDQAGRALATLRAVLGEMT
jgi:L-lysine 6-transaminase